MRPLATLAVGLALATAAAGRDLVAPNPAAKPLNQLRYSGNACGPAALLSAFDAGSQEWRDLARSLPGSDERLRLSYVIRAHGLRPSTTLANRHRWDRKNGVNLLDLTEIGNELRSSHWKLPKLKAEVLVAEGRETPARLLRRAHDRFTRSLKRGLPPIVSLTRLARPAGTRAAGAPWRTVYGHYVVVIALPARLERKSARFPIRYFDPWGGRVLRGSIGINPHQGYPSLLAELPSSDVGKKNVKPGETTMVTAPAVIGAF